MTHEIRRGKAEEGHGIQLDRSRTNKARAKGKTDKIEGESVGKMDKAVYTRVANVLRLRPCEKSTPAPKKGGRGGSQAHDRLYLQGQSDSAQTVG